MKCTRCEINDNIEYDIVLSIIRNGETHVPERIRILKKDLCLTCAHEVLEDDWGIQEFMWV